MIANAYLNEWRQTVPWSDNKMVEQDLIISRLLAPNIQWDFEKAAIDVFEKIIHLIPGKPWKSMKVDEA